MAKAIERPHSTEPRNASVFEPTITKRITRTDQLLSMLGRPEGVSVEEIVEALGWLPHTVRAALTGLRKKGHAITRDKVGSVTVYKVSA